MEAERCRPVHPVLAISEANNKKQNIVRSFFDRGISDTFRRSMCVWTCEEYLLAVMSWARSFRQAFLASVTVIGCPLLRLCFTSGRLFFFR